MKPLVILKILLLLAVVIAAGLYVVDSRRRAGYRDQYNRIVTDLMNQEKYQEAVQELERLLATAPEDLKPRIRKDLARCCLSIGEDPGLPIARSAEWFKRAQEYDPASLEERHHQVLRLGTSPGGTGGTMNQ